MIKGYMSLPARIDDCVMSCENLRNIHHVDLFPDWHEAFQQIQKAIIKETILNIS